CSACSTSSATTARSAASTRRAPTPWRDSAGATPMPSGQHVDPGASSHLDHDRRRTMIQGLRTVIYPVPQLADASDWYRRVLDRAPYFDQPFYVGFEVGGFELGLVPDGTPGTAGATAYWG